MPITQTYKVEQESHLPNEAKRILIENPEESLIILGVSDEVREQIRETLKEIEGRSVLNGTTERFFDDLFKYRSDFRGNAILFMDTDASPALHSNFSTPQPFAARILPLTQKYQGIQLVVTTPLPDAAESIDTRFHDPLKEFCSSSYKRPDGSYTTIPKPIIDEIKFTVLSAVDPQNYSIKDLNPFRRRT